MKKQTCFLVLVLMIFVQFSNAQVPNYVPINGLISYWGFSGNANDSSGNGHNGTVNGATLTTDRFGNANSAYNFNGVNNSISVPANINFTQNPISYSFWFNKAGSGNPCSGNEVAQAVFSTGSYSQSRDVVLMQGTTRYAGMLRSIPSGCIDELTQPTNYSLNTWNHLVITYEANIVKVYLNGAFIGSTPVTCPVTAANTTCYIGASNPSIWACINYFNGKIDDLAIFNRVLSGSEVSTLYNGDVAIVNCPPLSGTLTNGLVAYYPFCGNANDASGSNNNGTVNGATLTTDRFGNANSAYNFNGVNNSISVPANINFTQNPISYSFWFNKAGSGNPCSGNEVAQAVFSTGSFSQSRDVVLMQGTTRYAGMLRSIPSGCSNELTQPTNYSLNTWNHLVITYEANIVKVYLNGAFIGSTPVTCPVTAANTTCYIGASNPSIWACINYFNGKIDDLAIFNRVLSGSEVSTLYNGDVAIVNCPPLSGTLTNGLVAYYPFCGNANDASGSNNNGTVNGATLTTDRFGNDNSAYSFNGNQENIKVQNSLLPSTPTSFTISMWLKYEGGTGSLRDVICDRSMANYSYKYRLLEGQVNNSLSYSWWSVSEGNSASTVNATNLSSNWENIIGVTDIATNQMRLYRNGILIGTSINGYQYPNETNPTYIGANIGPNGAIDPSFLGVIDDVCVWNRVLTDQEIQQLYNANICYQSVTVTDTLIINTGILSYNPITYNNTVTIYPNPAKDHITVDCGALANVVGYSIKIINTLGQEVFNQPMNTQQYYIPLNSWSGQGVYFVNVIDAQGHTIDIKKIILQ